ncbi:MAG: hypothetical protein Q9162_002358 [Coniocarpon cinnabarinum]
MGFGPETMSAGATPSEDDPKTGDASSENRDSTHAIACISCSTRKIPHGDDEQEEEEQDPLQNDYAPGSVAPTNSSAGFGGFLMLAKHPSQLGGGELIDPKSQYLTREQALILFDVFLTNVDPLTKMVHIPTLKPKFEKAIGNPAAVPRKFDALLFAILFAGASSMTDRDCQDLLYTNRTDLVNRLQDTASRALVFANVLTTNEMEVVQAFVFYLLGVRASVDLRTMWMLTGNAIRIAIGMGLHRGGAFESYFSPFEIEYRRRLWWQIAYIDTRVGELAGFGASPVAIDSDAKSPGNYNDSDLCPEMKELPPTRTGATEFLFCHARSSGREFGRSKGLAPLFMGLSKFNMSLSERERRIREMEAMFENNLLRYCDPLEPLHVLVSVMARSLLQRLRLKAYHPVNNRNAEDEQELSRKGENICFDAALKSLEYDNHVFGSKILERFHWHIRALFQYDALIFVLSELKRRGHTLETVKAWRSVEECFNNHPEFTEGGGKSLHLAINNLCLKAWSAREATERAGSPNGLPPQTPQFIQRIREKLAVKRKLSASPGVGSHGSSEATPDSFSLAFTGGAPPTINQPDFAALANASLDPTFFEQGTWSGTQMDWSLWNDNLNFGEPTFGGLPWHG